MSIFKSMNKIGNGGAPRTERFFGEVLAIEPKAPTPFIKVRHTETGDERVVVLDQDVKINVSEGRSRPDIVDFTRGKMKTAIGGFVRIEGALEDKANGNWKARWITGAVHTPDEGRVATIKEARVSPLIKREGGGEYRMLDELDGAKATRVTSPAQLQEALTAAIQSHGSALIRFSDCTEVQGSRSISGGARTLPEADRVRNALTNKYTVGLMNAAGQLGPNDVLEVVPMKRHFFGGDAAKHKSLDHYFVSSEGGKLRDKGFANLLVTFLKHEDGTEFVSSATPKGFGFAPEGKFLTAEANIVKKDAPAASAGTPAPEAGSSGSATASEGTAPEAAASAPSAAPVLEPESAVEIDDIALDELLGTAPPPAQAQASARGPGM